MSLNLKQLKEKRDNHVKKIEEYKAKAKDYHFDSIAEVKMVRHDFFNTLSETPLQEINNIIRMYPHVSQVLYFMNKSAKEEKKRRECERKIAMMEDRRLKKRKREDDDDEECERRSLRMKMITDGSGEGKSQITEMDTI